MLDPEADTEWNDVLRAKGILPPKQKEAEITEDALVEMAEQAIAKLRAQESGRKNVEDMTLEELDEWEDDEDEAVLEQYRQMRIAEMKASAARKRFGQIINISAPEYTLEINQAGSGIWVVLLLYKGENMLCRKLQAIFGRLTEKFPHTKFVQSISTNCIPNYPDANLPTVFIYYEGEMKKQFIGAGPWGGESVTVADVEWILGQIGAVETTMEENPRRSHVKDALTSKLNYDSD
eukprot:m.134609 g.134609  ORF g.134609 m.134609 type:complete len:235 (-) comp52443_c0_seq1:102-806(-)